jgi:hypothetical protein
MNNLITLPYIFLMVFTQNKTLSLHNIIDNKNYESLIFSSFSHNNYSQILINILILLNLSNQFNNKQLNELLLISIPLVNLTYLTINYILSLFINEFWYLETMGFFSVLFCIQTFALYQKTKNFNMTIKTMSVFIFIIFLLNNNINIVIYLSGLIAGLLI